MDINVCKSILFGCIVNQQIVFALYTEWWLLYFLQLQSNALAQTKETNVKFQLAKDNLNTMMQSMYCIKDQLSDAVSVAYLILLMLIVWNFVYFFSLLLFSCQPNHNVFRGECHMNLCTSKQIWFSVQIYLYYKGMLHSCLKHQVSCNHAGMLNFSAHD